MTPAQKTNAALTDVCRLLLDEWELTPQEIANLAKDIPGECEAMEALRDRAMAEIAHERGLHLDDDADVIAEIYAERPINIGGLAVFNGKGGL